MFILLTDETNTNEGKNAKFLVYGGLFFPMVNLERLHSGIDKIRKAQGFKTDDKLKWDTNSRPKHVSLENFKRAKSAVITFSKKCECKFIAYVIHHKIAKGAALSDHKLTYAADHVIGAFNYFLQAEGKARGICLVDPMPINSPDAYLKEKFTDGLCQNQTKTYTALSNILLFGETVINASHASSAMDIVLGAFQYCINNPSYKVCKEIMPKVADMMWYQERKGEKYIRDYGLIVRPKGTIKVAEYQKDYTDLFSSIEAMVRDV